MAGVGRIVKSMRSKRNLAGVALAASLAPVLAGLVTSAILAVDYLRPTPVFCAEGGGCEAVRHTPFAAPLGVPTPAVGLVGFLAIGVVSLLAGRRARVGQLGLSIAAAIVGVMLLAEQATLGRICVYCCVADASAIAAALAAWWRFVRAADPAPSRILSYAGVALLPVAIVVPLVLGLSKSPRIPTAIRAEIAVTPRGGVTIVDFVDFECPFCRMTHAELEPIVELHRDRLRVARRQVPLQSHPHALDAARAACCGERLGKGEAMANALFTAPVDELTRDGCEKIAQSVGLALDPYRACLADPTTDQRIEADRAEFKASGGYALPTIWINARQMIGAQPREALEKAVDEALARAGG